MQAHTVERVESWGSRPFSDGVRDLQDLADGDFSGAAVADDTWLFMLNGRVVGVYEGEIEDFEDASGTVYDAPHPSLPLLFSMRERGGETQAKYYTNDTPLSDVDETLAEGNFTGYVELSENVLSGDYYVVYHGGRSMSAAFVGASEELVAGDDAFERASEEVGVYEVCKTAVHVTDLPSPGTEERAQGPGRAAGGTAASAAADDSTSDSDTAASDDGNEPGAVSNGGVTNATEPTDAPSDRTTGMGVVDDADADAGTTDTDEDAATDDREFTASGDDSTQEGVFDDEEEWRNARSIPTLDPKQSEDSASESEPGASSQSNRQASRSRTSNQRRSPQSDGNSRAPVEKLKQAVRQRNAKLEAAEERIESLEGDRSELRGRVEALQEGRDELQARIEELEATRSAGGGGGGGSATSSAVALDPERALADTNLFVRYGSKGKPTLDELDAETDADAVNKNLRIDHHTKFDAKNATVDGEPFEAFLASSNAYRFVSWAVRELPYEIRDAGHASGLGDLYGALPRVDRAELGGAVDAELEDETVSRSFDVVLRDRMGEALVVAELNDSRDAVTGDEMDALVSAATDVREGAADLSAAMYVTASFFDPRALETASDATGGGGFLSRSGMESYVRVARKEGYHLCLVEDRNDAFHLNVPEL